MDAANELPKREAEFFITRMAQLPNRMIGNQPHQQSIQINCNVFTTDTPEAAIARVKRAEELIAKLHALHEANFIESMIDTTKQRMQSEMDVMGALQEEAKTQGRAMKQNRRDMMNNLPAQVEKTKQQLEVLHKELQAKRKEAAGLI